MQNEKTLNHTKYVMSLLGNPQNLLKVILIAGTSGKGSTAKILSNLLISHGFKVGLHTKPHIKDVRESFVINNRLIDRRKFHSYYRKMMKILEFKYDKQRGPFTPDELLQGLSYLIMQKENVDYAVIEVGIGGLYDYVNTVTREDKIAVITTIGIDHTKELGDTLVEIANNKAGIIGYKNAVFTTNNNRVICQLKKQVKNQHARLTNIKEGVNYSILNINLKGSTFNYRYKNIVLNNLRVGLIGQHQVKNAALALSVFLFIINREKRILNKSELCKALKRVYYAGRFEVLKRKNSLIILDIAHNSQKIKALVRTIKTVFFEKKITFLISLNEAKNYLDIFNKIAKVASSIFLVDTSSVVINQIIHQLNREKKDNYNLKLIKINKKIFTSLIAENQILVVTGRSVLVSKIYQWIE